MREVEEPCAEVEELLACVILILKSPNRVDVTWKKGAKRIMANIDRFLNQLSKFDEQLLDKVGFCKSKIIYKQRYKRNG